MVSQAMEIPVVADTVSAFMKRWYSIIPKRQKTFENLLDSTRSKDYDWPISQS
jgi:hypothetical protein